MNTVGDMSVKGERALGLGDVDRLGFGEVAARIAQSLVDRASTEGLVIGLDGKWGSGKSSLIYLVERALKKLPEKQRPTIINFRPWLVGDRDSLLTALFADLADKVAAVELIRGDSTGATVQNVKQMANKLRKFGNAVSKAGAIIEIAGNIYQPLGYIGQGIKWLGDFGKESPETDLVALKQGIINDLRALEHRFIINVDDVDRLEPSEVVEVLRLVRSVADFPNIIYVLCYDAEILSAAIEDGANVEHGSAFLEKIVQLTVMVPQPEPFQLRQWFAEDLGSIVGSVAEDVSERLKTVIDQEGSIQLRTPRSVVRTLDSVRFLWPALKNEAIDVADLVWLILIKDGAPSLYRWIEEYSAGMAATSFGTANTTDIGKEKALQKLLDALPSRQLEDIMYRYMFAEQLPGIEADYSNEGPPIKIYKTVSQKARQAAISGRRLASPDHYRLYFSLVGPSHAVSQENFTAFWQATENGADDTAAVLLNLHSQLAMSNLRKSDVLLERLRTMPPAAITGVSARNLLLAFGQMMDIAYRISPFEDFFVVSTWDRAERLLPILLVRIADEERLDVIRSLFADGDALGWLTSIFRHEIFSHGIWGSQAKPPSEWRLSEADFNEARDQILDRYRKLSLEDMLAIPHPINVLFAWNQSGNEAEPREFVTNNISSDEALLNVLETMTGFVNSSDKGRYEVLKRSTLEPFFDFDDVTQRISTIAAGSPELKRRAARLQQAMNAANDL